MYIRTVSQPETPLGDQIDGLLGEDAVHARITFVSAFVRLRTILRLRERLLAQIANGARLRLTIGIDLGGTSRDVLDELLRWNCETFVFHNAIPRATFHPKIYLFESANASTLFVGSNNLTDGGFYTNYEAATRYDFEFPIDRVDYNRLLGPLMPFLEPNGALVQRLDAALIATLVARGELTSEAETRRRSRAQARAGEPRRGDISENPFPPVPVRLPPLLPLPLRREESETEVRSQVFQAAEPPQQFEQAVRQEGPRSMGLLVWRKRLPQTDALQVNPGSHHVGGVRLTQAGFQSPLGHIIDQLTYFRQIFSDYAWEPEQGRQQDQEHAFVPMRIIIKGRDYGIRNFEISHKPSGEAGQANYTTILRWGHEFNPTVVRENLTDTVFSLYETTAGDADFLIDITEA